MRKILRLSVFALVGCGSTAPASSAMQQRQQILDRIADHCGAPRNSWKLLDADHVTLERPAYAAEGKGNCLINELFKSKLPVKLGFIAEPPPESRE